MQTDYVVSKKGQVTLPAEMRELLGIEEGSRLHLVLRGSEIVFSSAKPMSAHYWLLNGDDLSDLEPEKEPDRTFE